jgi:N-acyl homoserine lactone hydrolase
VKIHAIQTGTVIIRPNQREGVGSGDQRYPNILNDSRWTEPLPINVWVIEHPEGIIVIDTGETSKASSPGYFPKWHPYWKNVKEEVKPEEEVGPQLQHLGINLMKFGG